MSTAEIDPATAANHVSDGLRQLRQWISGLSDQDPDPARRIRDEFLRSALSATLRRLVYFGIEPSLNRYTARELLQFQLMVAGDFSRYFARITWTRALVEDDGPVMQALADSGLVDDQVAWLQQLPADLPQVAGEELHVARLLCCRREPARFAPAWLWDIPDTMPRLGAAMAQAALMARPDCALSIGHWLKGNPAALASVESDDLLVRVVAASETHPQTTLAPFEGWYGDRTVIAAAEWHLEHDEPKAALTLCNGIRSYGPYLDQARLIAGLASLDLQDAAQAVDLRAALPAGPQWDILTLRLAEMHPDRVADSDLVAIARGAQTSHAQSFFTAVRLLISRRLLDEARSLCRDRGADFPSNAEITALCAAVLGRPACGAPA